MPLTDRQRADFDRLVHSKPVVLFMKGNRRFPACGFSATVVGILDKLTSGYETVNILEDPQVREGMKEFSSWPTFPQLYVKGEFVGGCDIVKEMYASGELQKLVGAEPPPPAVPATAPRVTISPAATKALLDALADAGGDVIRLAIDDEFRCDLQIAARETDDLEVTSGGAVLYVDRGSAARAEGIKIDFVEGPGGMAFKIDNPNEPPRVKRIAPKELKGLLDLGRIELFDVRPAAERARASIAQAKALDAQDLSALKRDAAIALHCHHGMRSRAAAEKLLSEGFTNVYNLEGGIEAWSRDVDPSVPHY
jgi:monothiol glutaredoxin